MAKFIPKAKLSKKTQKALNNKKTCHLGNEPGNTENRKKKTI